MAFTISSRFTFDIPKDIKDTSDGATATIRRISADGAIPIVMIGVNVRTYDEIIPNNYIVYDGEYRKIETVELNPDDTIKIYLENTLGDHWNEYPDTDTKCQWAKSKNILFYPTDTPPHVDFFYKIKSNNTENLVLDVKFTKAATNLTLELFTLGIDVTKELIRTDGIFNPDNYISEVYDTNGTISKRILTISATGTYRIPMDCLLVDQLLLIKVSDTTANLNMSMDIRENSVGHRVPLVF
jgi:hypothetical protein